MGDLLTLNNSSQFVVFVKVNKLTARITGRGAIAGVALAAEGYVRQI